MRFTQAILHPPVVTFAGSLFLDMTDCGRRSLLLNDAKAYNKTRHITSLARKEAGGGGGRRRDRLSHRRDKTYKTISIVRPVEVDAIDGFLYCENTDHGGIVAGCDCWILCF